MSNVSRGAGFERRMIHKLLKNGSVCLRGAASKTYLPKNPRAKKVKIDVVEINPKKRLVILRQMKNKYIGPNARHKLKKGITKYIPEGSYWLIVNVTDRNIEEQFNEKRHNYNAKEFP